MIIFSQLLSLTGPSILHILSSQSAVVKSNEENSKNTFISVDQELFFPFFLNLPWYHAYSLALDTGNLNAASASSRTTPS